MAAVTARWTLAAEGLEQEGGGTEGGSCQAVPVQGVVGAQRVTEDGEAVWPMGQMLERGAPTGCGAGQMDRPGRFGPGEEIGHQRVAGLTGVMCEEVGIVGERRRVPAAGQGDQPLGVLDGGEDSGAAASVRAAVGEDGDDGAGPGFPGPVAAAGVGQARVDTFLADGGQSERGEAERGGGAAARGVDDPVGGQVSCTARSLS